MPKIMTQAANVIGVHLLFSCLSENDNSWTSLVVSS